MRAARIHRFGGPDVILVEDVPRPIPASSEILVRVSASGVGPWDAIIREGKSRVSPQPPLTLGSDISGTVEAFGPDAEGFEKGDEVLASRIRSSVEATLNMPWHQGYDHS